MDTRRVLITGGAGFIGSHLAAAIAERGWTTVVLDDLSTGKAENIRPLLSRSNFSFVQGSILDMDLLREILRRHGITAITHQAARPSVARSIEDPQTTTAVNVTGTVHVLKAAAECGCRRVVIASSSSIYGDTPELPKHEAMPLNPKSPYACSKAATELYLRVFQSIYGLETIGLRYFNVYGPRQDPASQYAAVVPRFITAALAGRPLAINGDGGQTRDFTFIRDVIAANLQAIAAPRLEGDAVNIAFGARISILELARHILRMTGSASPIAHGPARAGDVRDSLADVSAAATRIGYRPEWPLERGLADTVDWYRRSLSA